MIDVRTPIMTVLAVLSLAAPACAQQASAPAPQAQGLRINQIQILGSHNSYRPYDARIIEAIRNVAPAEAPKMEYGNPPLAEQLDAGIRQLELDPVSDSRGGLFAGPYAAGSEERRIMERPGAKVLHVPPVDHQSHCLTLELCLRQVRAWSDVHPDHDLIVILINNRDAPEPYTAEGLDAVDATIASVLGADRIVTPDSVRGDHPTLREAVIARNWPTVEAARGKFLLVHDTDARITTLYAQGRPSLRGRMMFGLHDEGADEAAIFNVQDPRTEGERIRRLVDQGFLVRTRADANTVEARAGDLARLNAGIESGAQVISTDYYPGAPDPVGLGFVVRLADGFAQPNPRAATAGR